VSDNGNCSGYERAIAIYAINLTRKRVNKSSELNSRRQLNGLEIVMDHYLQALLAIGISAALCLVMWIWSRSCRTSVSHRKDN
jgi:hypothetical protein